jgi:hypothetical protein
MVSIPSWLQAADPADEYLKGLQIGGAISARRQELAADAANSQRDFQAKQQTAQQSHALDVAKMQADAAYGQQVIGIQQQKLDEAAQAVAAHTQAAAKSVADTIGLANYLKQNPDDVAGGLYRFPNASKNYVEGIYHEQEGAETLRHHQSLEQALQEKNDTAANKPPPPDTDQTDEYAPGEDGKPPVLTKTTVRRKFSSGGGMPIPPQAAPSKARYTYDPATGVFAPAQ